MLTPFRQFLLHLYPVGNIAPLEFLTGFTQIFLCVKNVKSRLWGFHFGFNSELNR